MRNKKTVRFLDTTLRDGEQAPGNAMTPEQKLALALQLEEASVDFIETGFPSSSRDDFKATQMISANLSSSCFATLARAYVADVKKCIEAGGTSSRHSIQLIATGSDLHLRNKRHITREQALEEVISAVTYARQNSDCRIAVGIEDASRAAFDFITDMTREAVKAGAHQVIVADTTGFATPLTFAHLIRHVKACAGENISVSTHCHNDLGLAVANSIAGIEAGADEVQVTLGGIGERAGNTSLEEIAALLHYKANDYQVQTNVKLDVLYEAFNMLRQIINMDEPRTKPIFGKYAFSTAAGLHQQGMINNPDNYEYVKPDLFGRQRQFYVAKHSGRSVIRLLLSEMNIASDETTVNEMYDRFIDNGESGCRSIDQLKKLIQREVYDFRESVGA